MFNVLCRRKGEEIYDRYHETLPGLKRVSRRAASRVHSKGYVRNIYGRRRHLPKTHCHIAFNALCQSSAADLMKERTVAADKMCNGTPIKLIANVHDEILFEAPNEVAEDPRVIRDLVNLMESPIAKLRVPICVDVGVSKENWAKASGDAAEPVLKDWSF
jgi:DNA polymerase-1